MNKSTKIFLTIVAAIVARLLVGTGRYSGQNDIRKGGDFEAQRHWMEITINIPVNEWYVETPDNELAWWGLDYPPLSGYWAWITGTVAKKINPQWVELGRSRRNEDPQLKWFMRLSVILSDLLLLIPAFLIFSNNRSYLPVMKLWVLANPVLLLIDHGHFQYNSLMLGFMTLAVTMLLDYKKPLIATLLVCCSSGVKQMGLYYIPAFAVYLLRQCIRRRTKRGLLLFSGLVFSGLATMSIICAPFLIDIWPVIVQIFPLHRGLFEDKVANFWCALAILTKFHISRPQHELVKLCAATLLAALAPSLVSLIISKPSGNRFLYALAYTSLCFFMFSYHVHEKNILTPLMPVLLLVHLSPIFVLWFSCLSALSLFQLIEKDHLEPYYFIAVTLWLLGARQVFRYMRFSWSWRLVLIPTLLALYIIPLAQIFLASPPRYPHLFHVIAMLGCSGGFILSLVYLLYKQFTCESHFYFNRNSLQHQIDVNTASKKTQ